MGVECFLDRNWKCWRIWAVTVKIWVKYGPYPGFQLLKRSFSTRTRLDLPTYNCWFNSVTAPSPEQEVTYIRFFAQHLQGHQMLHLFFAFSKTLTPSFSPSQLDSFTFSSQRFRVKSKNQICATLHLQTLRGDGGGGGVGWALNSTKVAWKSA